MDDPKAVLAQLPPAVIKLPVKVKDLRIQWDEKCSRILAKAHLSPELKIKVIMDWLHKANARDFVLGKLILSFARPLPAKLTEEQRKERRQKALVRGVYEDDIPHLRAVNKVVSTRLEIVPASLTSGSFKSIDDSDDRETENPGTMFAEFAERIEEQLALEYGGGSDVPFEHAAE